MGTTRGVNKSVLQLFCFSRAVENAGGLCCIFQDVEILMRDHLASRVKCEQGMPAFSGSFGFGRYCRDPVARRPGRESITPDCD